MNVLSKKMGLWSAILLTLTFVAWVICFMGIAITSPLFYWTNLNDYIDYVQNNNQFLQNTAKFFMLLFGPLYVIFINCFYDYAPKDKKILVRLSLLFGLAFAVLSSLHYFVQLSSVRLNIESGSIIGIDHFLQANPNSIMISINMLGWTLFLGLSSLFIFPIFSNDRLNRIIKYAFIANGMSCFLGGIGYMFQINILTFVFINLGVGGAFLTVAIASIKLFMQQQKMPA